MGRQRPDLSRTRSAEPVDVLREVWTAQGQSTEDLEAACSPKKVCKNMVNVGFDGLAADGGDLRAAWRDRLAREGKLATGAGTLRDLVLGSEATR